MLDLRISSLDQNLTLDENAEMTFLIRNFWMTYITVPFHPLFPYYKYPVFFRVALCPAKRLAFVELLKCSLRGCLLGYISVSESGASISY